MAGVKLSGRHGTARGETMGETPQVDPLGFIRCCLAEQRVYWTYHVNMRLRERGVTRETVLSAAGQMEIVEAYPKDKYLPSYLVLCMAGETPLHVLFAIDQPGQNVRIVTAYTPDPAEWMPDLETRRTSP